MDLQQIAKFWVSEFRLHLRSHKEPLVLFDYGKFQIQRDAFGRFLSQQSTRWHGDNNGKQVQVIKCNSGNLLPLGYVNICMFL